MESITNFNIRQYLPGSSCVIETHSSMPDDIIQLITNQKPNTDFVILQNADVWRYRDDIRLLNFLQNYNSKTTFIITTSGIDYIKIRENILEVPLPDAIDKEWAYTNIFEYGQRKYGYSCINNRQSWSRLLLGYCLWQADCLTNIIYSQNLLPDVTLAKINGPLVGYEQVLFESLSNHKQFLNLLPIRWHEELKVHFLDDWTISHDAFKLSYANIVTESETEFFGHDCRYPTPTISEKSFKPFLAGQINVTLAASGVIKFLEDHGFFMFREINSEKYDQLLTEDKITDIVKLVSAGTANIADIYFNRRNELEHNFFHLTRGNYTKSVVNRAVDFINENL